MTPELLSLVGGSTVGFLFRYIAEKRAAEAENFKRLLEMNDRTNRNQNEALKRIPVDAGKAVRRFIVIVILFGTILAPFVLPFFSYQPVGYHLHPSSGVEAAQHETDNFGTYW